MNQDEIDRITVPEEQDELVRWLARQEMYPVKYDGLYKGELEYGVTVHGRDVEFTPEYHHVIITTLGIGTDSKCERLREQIRTHPEWGEGLPEKEDSEQHDYR